MAEHSHIEWTDATWNPVTGCTVLSPGCTNCYAMKLAGTRLQHHPSRAGLTTMTKAGPVWNGKVRFNEEWLTQPLRWKRPRMIFVCAHGDLFHEDVPDEWIDKVFAVMALCPHHIFQVLTKRSARMRAYMSSRRAIRRIYDTVCDMVLDGDAAGVLIAPGTNPDLAPAGKRIFLDRWPLPNVWLGVSAEDQTRAFERVPHLLQTPATTRFLSAEPLLGPLELYAVERPPSEIDRRLTGQELIDFYWCDALTGQRGAMFKNGSVREAAGDFGPKLDWVIVGGESGPGARPMHPDWARSLRDQCADAGVPFFFKQWGSMATVYDRDADDPDWRECDKIARRTPNGRWLNLAGGHGFHGDRVVRVTPVGKKIAGRLLDGVEHNGMPRAPATSEGDSPTIDRGAEGKARP
ncbi:MAG: phage Gp37/Gp68 family protein [Rhodobiaceae bacterium]|nr:phage Gp37/Gp68 family protein [Rhodobiaceae bacterium]MCC0055875.1 phage Gp37/Gp68 family protein [Rhodobiaceae bacterium]